jgi:hypothetical protein
MANQEAFALEHTLVSSELSLPFLSIEHGIVCMELVFPPPIPPSNIIEVKIFDEAKVYDALEEPPTVPGYWILGVWCRLVRGRHDIIKAEDHNNVKEVLTRALNLMKQMGYK